MTQRFSVRHALVALAAGLIAIGTSRPAAAEAGACHDLVGTYLTKNFAKGESERELHQPEPDRALRQRTGLVHRFRRRRRGGLRPLHRRARLVALHRGEQGACVTLDFTTPTAEEPRLQIGRLDFDLVYDAASKTIKGTATLRLIPLGADPLTPLESWSGRQFEIVGQRVEAP